MDLDRIYTDLILEASTSKKNQREIENPDVEELGHNPSCGDEITIVVKFDGDKIADASYHGEGCAISKASTSFMIDTIKGQTIDQAKVIIQSYLDMIRGEKLTAEQMKSLKDARVLENIKNMPARVKCATLSWHTMQNILADKSNLKLDLSCRTKDEKIKIANQIRKTRKNEKNKNFNQEAPASFLFVIKNI